MLVFDTQVAHFLAAPGACFSPAPDSCPRLGNEFDVNRVMCGDGQARIV